MTLFYSRFRMQRASWRYQILAKLLVKFRQKRRPECVTITSGLVALNVLWVAIPAAYIFNLRIIIMVTVSSTRNFWIEYLFCNGDIESKIKDQTEFCTLYYYTYYCRTLSEKLQCMHNVDIYMYHYLFYVTPTLLAILINAAINNKLFAIQ